MWTFILVAIVPLIVLAIIGLRMLDEDMTERYRRSAYPDWTDEEIVRFANSSGQSDRIIEQARKNIQIKQKGRG